MTPVYDFKSDSNVHCELPECNKVTTHVFRIYKEGISINTCSTYHANEVDKRWEEKKKLNIRMGVPQKEENEVYEGDNIEEF